MFKRIFATVLCILMLLPTLAACSGKDEDEELGAYITMYLTNEIYDFDPINAYYNSDTFNVVSLLFDTLFKLDQNGEIQKSLVKEYKIIENKDENEYAMELTLNETYWSNGNPITADDVVFAWKRLLNANNNYEAAAMLFDIKNARAVKQGDESIDNLGVEAVENKVVKVIFEGLIDYDQFLLNLTSLATAPLPESYVTKDADWAKKSSTMVSSGAYKLAKTGYSETGALIADDYAMDANGNVMDKTADYKEKKISYFVLERNRYYYRDDANDSIRSSVTNYRILVDCTKSGEEILKDYQDGKIFYIGDVPYSVRNNETYTSYLNEHAQLKESLSTLTLFLNQNQLIEDGANGTKLFAIKEVRQALSMVIDRDQIAQQLVYANAATGLVPYGVFNTNAKKKADTFREVAENPIKNTSADVASAKNLLQQAKINADDYSFAITVAAYDAENIAVANIIKDAWCNLGFHVTVKEVSTIENNDILKLTGVASTDICDNLFEESIQRVTYDVVLYDYVAYSADPYSILANFAKAFSGMAIDMDADEYSLTAHRTGYDSTDYNNLMEAIYYIPYFASLNYDTDFDFLGIYETKEEFQAVYNTVKKIYEQYNITATTDSSKWTAQKAILLAAAETLLMDDMPVIPVVYNRDAVLISDQLKEVSSNYYIPASFRKTDLKDFDSYTYIDRNGNQKSIFSSFPEVEWDKKGTDESGSQKSDN